MFYLLLSLIEVSGGEDNLSTLFPLKESAVAWQKMDWPLRTLLLLKNSGKGFVNKWKLIRPEIMCLLSFV